MNYSSTISDSWAFFREHFKSSLAFMFPIILAITIIGDFLVSFIPLTDPDRPEDISLTLFGIAFLIKANFFALAVSLYLYFMKNIIFDTELSNKEIIKEGIKNLPPILFLTTVASILIYIASLALIIPGIYIALRFSYAWFYMVFEDLSPLEALKKSVLETKEELQYITISLGIVLIPSTLLIFFLFLLITLMFDGVLLSLITSLFFVIIFIFVQIILYRIYAECGNDLPEKKKKTTQKVSL